MPEQRRPFGGSAEPTVPSQLSKAAISRIVTEERFRERLRAELAPSKEPGRGKILDFLNSPLGLFLLSSVLIAGLGRVYADMRAREETQRATRASLIELLTEFDLRTTQSEYYAKQIESGPPAFKVPNCVLLWRLVSGDQAYQPSAPTFYKVHWLGLLSRARVLTMKSDIKGPTQAVERLELNTDGGNCSSGAKLSPDVAILRSFSDSLNRSLE